MSLDLKSVELFTRIAALNAIGRAGEEFGYSPTTASQRIQALEAELGVTLFLRTTRSVTLTQDGELFLTHAQSILSGIEDARLDLSGGATRLKGLLRVTASASFGQMFISPYIAEFIDQHPEARLHLNLTDSIVDIVAQGYDLSIRIGTLPSSTLRTQKLANNPRSLVASKKYIERMGMPDSVKDLAHHNCIFQGVTRQWGFKAPNGKIETINVSGNFDCNHGEAIRDAVINGLGIGLRSDWSIKKELINGDLISLLPDHEIQPVWEIYALRPPGPIMPARVRVFLEFLRGKLKDVA
ncbi:MAG: LysR family transcriptional regulator [Hellea sp.]